MLGWRGEKVAEGIWKKGRKKSLYYLLNFSINLKLSEKDSLLKKKKKEQTECL